MTTTPMEDGAMKELVEFLAAGLNEGLRSYYQAQSLPEQVAVPGGSAYPYMPDLAAVSNSQYPILICHRVSAQKQPKKYAIQIKYIFSVGLNSLSDQPGIMDWVLKKIFTLLEQFPSTGCLRVVPDGIRGEYSFARLERARRGAAGGDIIIPYVQIDLSVQDYSEAA